MKYYTKFLIVFAFGTWLASGQTGKKSKLVDAPAAANRLAETIVSPAPDMTATARVAAPLVGPEYRIGAGDVLEISVWKEPDASVPSATVRPDGRISVPFTKEIRVAGLTPLQLEAMLTERLLGYFRNPQITVLVREVNSQKIYVIGEVKKEGGIRLQFPLTVLQALAEAGGITDYAKKSKIQIFRTEDQKQKVYPFDYGAVVRGQHIEQNFQVLPGDTIVVPR
jgi:polysaccharide export outer membrane protein